MNRIQVGDTVAFRRRVVMQTGVDALVQFRASVVAIAGEWLFLNGFCGCQKVMRAADMVKVASSGVVLELV